MFQEDGIKLHPSMPTSNSLSRYSHNVCNQKKI